MNIIRNILRTIRLVIVSVACGVDVGIAYAAPYAAAYLKGLAYLFGLVVTIPLVFVAVGVVYGWPGWTAGAGLFWGITLLGLGVWGAPLGVLISALREALESLSTTPAPRTGFFLRRWIRWWLVGLPKETLRVAKDGAMRYVRFARGVILAECIVALGLAVIPVRTIPEAVPIFALAVIVAILATVHWKLDYGIWKKFVYGGALTIAVILIVAFFTPDISRALVHRWKLWQKNTAREVETRGIGGLNGNHLDTNAPVALLMPPGDDLVIPPDATFVKVSMTATNVYSGWIHLPYEWGWTDLWAGTGGGFWVQQIGEDRPFWCKNNAPVVLKRGPFRVAGEGGFFFLRRKT